MDLGTIFLLLFLGILLTTPIFIIMSPSAREKIFKRKRK